MESSLKYRKSRSSAIKEPTKCIIFPVSDRIYINTIIANNNTTNNLKSKQFSFMNYLSHIAFNSNKLNKYLLKLKYILKPSSKYKSLNYANNNTYLYLFLHMLLFIYEIEDYQMNSKKEEIEKFFLLLLKKLFLLKKIEENDIIIILKFAVYSSIYERKEIGAENIDKLKQLNEGVFKNSSRIKSAIDILKTINNSNITNKFCEFLINNFLSTTPNILFLSSQSDLLELLYLTEVNNLSESPVIDLLTKIYSFRYDKFFLNIFIEKIKIANANPDNIEKNELLLQLLNNIYKSIFIINKINTFEENIYKNDPNLLPIGFIFNNNIYSGAYLEKIIVQGSLTLIFSFCFSPSKKLKPNSKTNKNSSENIYPIITLKDNDNNDFGFFIKGDILYHKIFKDKVISIGPIKENLTYICYYSIKEHENFIISIKSETNNYEIKADYKHFLKKNFNLFLGKYEKKNFEGYIGPILIFGEYLSNKCKNYIFALKGHYSKILFFHDYDTNQIDKYDKFVNYILSDNNSYSQNSDNNKLENKDTQKKQSKQNVFNKFMKRNTSVVDPSTVEDKLNNAENNINNSNYYINLVKELKENININKNLIGFIIPLKKKIKKDIKDISFIRNNIFTETTIKFFKEPKLENCATLYFMNKSTMFEFLKYEGFNYLIMILEIIISGTENINYNDEINKLVISIFDEMVKLILEIFDKINTDFYLVEIRNLLFSIKKFILHFGKRNAEISNKILDIFFRFINYFENYTNDNINKKFNFIDKKKNTLIIIRNESCKIILNPDLYFLSNSEITTEERDLLINLINIISKITNTSENNKSMSIYMFKKLIKFSQIFNIFSKFKNDDKINTLKIKYKELLIQLLSNSENLNLLYEIYKNLSANLDCDYIKYQFIKIFYLVSNVYFSNIKSDFLIKTLKFFVELFCSLMKEEKNSNNNNNTIKSGKKEKNAVIGISLSLILENIKLLCIYNKTNTNKTFDIIEYFNEKMILQEDNEQKIEEENLKENKRSNSISSTTSGQLNLKIDDINLKTIENKTNSKSPNKSREISISITDMKDDKQNNNDTSNINKLSENYIYQKIFENLADSLNLNDFIFKSLLLFLLEKNNNIILPQYIRYNFILKTKEYSQLDNFDFKSVLILKNCKKEIATPFIQLVKMINKNKNNITTICYDILLYILMKALQDRTNRNVYCLFVENKYIFPNLFKYAFLNNQLAANNILSSITEMCKLIIPYHNRYNTITYILYLTLNDSRNLMNYFNKIMNYLLSTKIDNDNPKVIYDFLINKLIIVHDIVCSYDDDDKINSTFMFNCEGLLNLACSDLINTKFAFFNSHSSHHKKKCYIALLYELFFTIYIKTKNIAYLKLINTIFIENIKNYKKKYNCKTILFHIDKLNLSGDKKNPCLKLYSKFEKIEEESICILLLKSAIFYWAKYKDISPQITEILDKYVDYFCDDVKLIFKESKNFRKKTKNNTWYNFFVDKLTEAEKQKHELNIKDIQKQILDKQNSKNKSGEKSVNYSTKNENEIFNDSMNFSFNIKTEEKNEYSFVTQDLSKLQNDESIISYSNTISTEQSELNSKKNNKKIENINNKNTHHLIKSNTTTSLLKPRNQEFQYLSIKQIKKNPEIQKTNVNLNDFDFNLENINFYEKVTLFPKRNFLQQNFACYFTDVLFINKFFIKIRQYYKYYVKKINSNYEIDTSNYFNYPIVIKNYTPGCFYYGDFFVKNDQKFFVSNFLKISHKYCINKIEEYNEKQSNKIINIFPKITEVDNLNSLIISSYNQKDFTTFYVDLVTNRNIVFGNLKINENILYFENMNKEKFINDLDDNEKINYLLCSLDCDYSNRKKKIYIFKNEIKEIIIRRFLYQFQACELFLKNGKSYYFNFYTLENKNKFLSLFFPKGNNNYKSNITITSQNLNIEIICDLKSYFKKKNYTKKWINNEISTLEYLLYINKFSSRSYNDINQYPVFPWLDLYDDSKRNLKYTVAAQDENDRNELAETYENSSESFPYHYTTHYSNSAFVIYYLVRINPYTNNQIILQVNKFDAPERQFDSINGVQTILHETRQPRELIPEFFINTEFFYNYNCNFFGIRLSDDGLIDKLINKNGYNSPLDYILNNIILLESPIIKTDLNYFIDNIFGINQKGGVEGYNTYGKYCYQEKVNLRQKIIKFKNEGLTYKEIRDKIETKSNKIISFGQTPFKLFDSSHQQWQPNRSFFKDNSNFRSSLRNSGRISFMPRASISNNPPLINDFDIINNYDNKEKILESENKKENNNENVDNNNDFSNIYEDVKDNLNDNINNDNIDNSISNMEEEEKNIMGINLQADIILFDVCDTSNNSGNSEKKYIYTLIKKSKRNYELQFFDLKFNKISSFPTIHIAKELKFFSKLKIFNSKFLFSYKYNPKYIFLSFKLSLFLFCHLRDNSFIIYDKKGASKNYLTESLVTCLTKINENSFISGHLSGKIIEWKFISPKNTDNTINFNSNLNEIKIISERNIFAHKNHVVNIIYCKDIDILISSGEDKKIFIRKYYDFSLLTMINFDNKLCIDIKLNHYFLNVLFFDETEQKYIIEVYSVNGIIVSKSKYELINNFDFDSEGNVLVGYYKSNIIDIYDPSLSVIKDQIVLKIGEKSKIIGGSKKKIKSGDIVVDDQNLFTSFSYDKLNNSVYCSFSNGILLRKKISPN